MKIKALLIVLITTLSIVAMDTSQEPQESSERATINALPTEIKIDISHFLAASESQDLEGAQKAAGSLRALARTNRQFNAILNDDTVMEKIIHIFHQHYKISRLQAASVINLPAAGRWYQKYMIKNYAEKNSITAIRESIRDGLINNIPEMYAFYIAYAPQGSQWLIDDAPNILGLLLNYDHKPEAQLFNLILNKINARSKDINGDAAHDSYLMKAILAKNTALIEVLLKRHDVLVNQESPINGRTPLMQALISFKNEIFLPDFFKVLIEHPQLQVNAQDKKGYTALDYLFSENEDPKESKQLKELNETEVDMLNLLETRGAKRSGKRNSY